MIHYPPDERGLKMIEGILISIFSVLAFLSLTGPANPSR